MSERISDERLAELIMYHETRRGETAAIKQISDYHGDEVAALRELASLREQARWRPMEEAPRDGTTIFALLDGSDLSNVVRYHDGGWVVAWDHYRLDDANLQCWMPLPEIGPLPGGDA